MLKEFKNFALKGNVVDMAVGVIIGGAFGKIVTSLVNDIVMPFISVLTSGVNFAELKYTLVEGITETIDGVETVTKAAVTVNYGMFIQNIVDFLIIAFSIFITLKIIFKRRDERLKKEAEEKDRLEAEKPKPETELDVLTEIRELLKANVNTQE